MLNMLVLKPSKSTLEKQMLEEVDLVGVVDKLGRMHKFFGSKDISLSKDKKDMLFMQMALHSSMQHDFDEELGPTSFCLVQRDNLKFISRPISDNRTVFVVTRNNLDYESTMKKVTNYCSSPVLGTLSA